MRYDVFRAKGYDIGSGAVEAACKNVVGKRLKQSAHEMVSSRLGVNACLEDNMAKRRLEKTMGTKAFSCLKIHLHTTDAPEGKRERKW